MSASVTLFRGFKPCENLDYILKLIVDGDQDDFLVANLAKAIETRIDLHRIHAITQTVELYSLGKVL